MSEIINFEFDRPVEVALRFTEPRIFPSKFQGGDDRHMFSTVDGRVMYVTPLTSARITALNLSQGECFYICKRKAGRVTEFAVSREPIEVEWAPRTLRPPAPFKTKLPERLYAPAPASEHEPAATLEEQLRASIEMVERRKTGEQPDGTLAVLAPPARPAAQAQTPVKPAERMAPAVAEFSSRLVLETNALVDCYAAALKTASERHGNTVKPDDVRSLLVTAYINASKQAGRNAA